jgi:hypothetical protein
VTQRCPVPARALACPAPQQTSAPATIRFAAVCQKWEDYHLHQFYVGETVYGEPDPGMRGMGFDRRDERRAYLNKMAPTVGSKCAYQYDFYDFGDSWGHTILVEKILEPEPDARYPRCLTGRRACPPEDCGGIWGYYQLIETLKHPSDPEYAEMREWVGDDFDPEAFSLAETNADLAALG